MTEPIESWEDRRARIEAMTNDERHAQLVAEYPHNHDESGHFINRQNYTPDGQAPRDPYSGVYLTPDTKPWHHHVGHPDYQPHPESIAALEAKRLETERLEAERLDQEKA